MNKIKYGIAIFLCLSLFLAAGVYFYVNADHRDHKGDGKQEDTENKLTIWLDRDNEFDVRYRVAFYKRTRNQAQGSDKAADFTDLDFELVPKYNLSPEQFRKELTKALENGNGPDILYMDAYNGINPLELMEAGRLAPLSGDLTERAGEKLEYASGALEAGEREGKRYVLPISMECPVVFGIREELEAAGIQTDTMYSSLDEFLDALLEAQEKTGKMIFESPEAADWLEQYYLPQNGAQELSEKLARIRTLSGEDVSQFGAYHGLSERKCLLGGCGMYDYKKLGVNASLFGERQLAMLAIPDSSGSVRGLITHSAAVNADSENAEEASKALLMFQYCLPYWPDITVINEKNYNILTNMDSTLLLTKSALALPDQGISEKTAEEFIRCSVQGCSSMSYVQEYGDRVSCTEKPEAEKNVFSICFANTGDGDDNPFGSWLNQAAEAYMQSHSDTYIQLLSEETSLAGISVYYQEMHSAGTAPDAFICPAQRLAISGLDVGSGTDFGRMLEDSADELDFLSDVLKEGVRYEGSAIGLPVQIREYGAWVSRRMLEQAGLSEDWKPVHAEELTKGMKQLAKTAGPSYLVFGSNELKALALFAEPDGLLIRQEDGSFRCSRESWTSSLAMIKNWKDAGIALPASGLAGKREAIQKLADGKTGMVFGCSDLSGYIDGAYGAAMTKEQQEDLVFLPLSPAADADILFVSDSSDSAAEVFEFWKEALRHLNYNESIYADCGIPVTEASEGVRQILPLQEMKGDIAKLWDGLWETDASAEELAGQYPLYEWAEDM